MTALLTDWAPTLVCLVIVGLVVALMRASVRDEDHDPKPWE